TYIVDQENSAAPALSPFVNIRFRIFNILARPMPSGASSGLKCRFRSWSVLSFDVNLIFLSFVSCARSQRSSMRPSTSTKRVIGTGSFPFSRNRYDARPHAGCDVNDGLAVSVRTDTSSEIGATKGTGYQSSRVRYPV